MVKIQKMFSFRNAVTDGLTHRLFFPEHVRVSCENYWHMAESYILKFPTIIMYYVFIK